MLKSAFPQITDTVDYLSFRWLVICVSSPKPTGITTKHKYDMPLPHDSAIYKMASNLLRRPTWILFRTRTLHTQNNISNRKHLLNTPVCRLKSLRALSLLILTTKYRLLSPHFREDNTEAQVLVSTLLHGTSAIPNYLDHSPDFPVPMGILSL